jgi:hypothetical protein
MGRSRGGRSRDKNKATLPQVPKNLKSDTADGLDVEFSLERADHDDLEALARSQAADNRVHGRQNNKR